MRFDIGVHAFIAASCAAGAALAQTYPAKPVRLIVPFAAGSTDSLSRGMATRLSVSIGQPMVVDNRPGASGNMGTELGAKAPPDGYTLVVGTNGPVAISPGMYKLGYDPQKDLVPVAMFAAVPYLLVVDRLLPVTSARELVALAKAKPGTLNYSSSGVGGTPHLCTELFKLKAGIDIVHVPYKGGSLAANDILGGQIQMQCNGVSGQVGLVTSGKIRALAVASDTRSPLLPDVPTMAEAGYPGVEVKGWAGLMGPAGMPDPIVRMLAGHVRRIVDTDDMKKFILNQGAESFYMAPEAFGAYVAAELRKWSEVIRTAKISAE